MYLLNKIRSHTPPKVPTNKTNTSAANQTKVSQWAMYTVRMLQYGILFGCCMWFWNRCTGLAVYFLLQSDSTGSETTPIDEAPTTPTEEAPTTPTLDATFTEETTPTTDTDSLSTEEGAYTYCSSQLNVTWPLGQELLSS